MTNRSLVLGIVSAVVLSACSDSVLFDKGPAPVPGPGAPGPGQPGPGGGYPGQGQGYPEGQGYPGGQQGYPGQGQYPGQQYPGQQGQYPTQNGPFQGQGQVGYPQQNGNGGFVGGGYSRPQNSSGSSSGPVMGGVIQRQMTFTLNPDTAISEDEIFQILFTDQAVDPFKVNQIESKSEMKMLVKSDRIQGNVNYVKMKIILTMRMGKETSLVREFNTEEPAAIRSENGQDVLEGYLTATDKRSNTKIFVTARRNSTPANVTNNGQSYDDTYLWKNAWSGELKVEKNGRKLRIGQFQGFMSAEESR